MSGGLRIAMYHFSLPQQGRKPGGVEVFVDRLAAALVKHGNEVVVFTYSEPPPGASYGTKRLRPHSTEHRRLLRQYGSPWLLNFQRFDGFDVAHFHGDDWFFFRRNLPVVRTFHGSALLEATSATSWKRRLDKAAVFPLELLAGRLATAKYGVGVDSEAIYRTAGLLNLGVDPPTLERQPSTNPSILFIGTWAGRKRGALLHEKFRREIRPAFPDAELWMVADHCEPADGVKWIQAPSDAEIAELFSRAWAFCLPSSYEGFGIPYLEAMVNGVPVLASPNAGSRTVLAAGGGRLVDDEALGPDLIELLGDKRLREEIGAAGRKAAEAYSWDRMASRHEDAYRRATASWSRDNPTGRPEG
jgi:glycosyltransferase involved in cell wall biosynthesis